MKFIEYILDNRERLWSWEEVSANANVTWEDIIHYNDIPWDFIGVSRNPNITIDILNTLPFTTWSCENLIKNPNIIVSGVIDKYYLKLFQSKDSALMGSCLSENPSVSWEFIQAHPYILWNYDILSSHPNITWDIITKNLHLPWNHRGISANPNINWDIVSDAIHSNNIIWDFHNISKNPGIMIDDIIDNLVYRNQEDDPFVKNLSIHYSWCWFGLSANPNVTWNNIIESKDNEYFKGIRWNYYHLSSNPNINMNIINDNPDISRLWSLKNLSANSMDYYDWSKVVSRQDIRYILK